MPKQTGKFTRTLVLLKPDAIERNLTGEILKRFERKGLSLVAAEMRWIDQKLAGEHYAEHKGNAPHFKSMTEALTRGPLMAVVLEGTCAVESSRQLIGAQSPLYNSQIGTIRADLAIEEPYNLVHGADSDHAAQREITLWFGAQMVKATKPEPKSVAPKGYPAPQPQVEDIPAFMMPPKIPKKIPEKQIWGAGNKKGLIGYTPQQLNKYKDDMMKVLMKNGVLPVEEELNPAKEYSFIGAPNGS